MSSGYWQTKRQSEQFSTGNTITQRVKDYVTTWESRCYFDGIPEELAAGIAKSGRVPSYKAIAIAILKNDHNFYSLGFSERPSELVNQLIQSSKAELPCLNYDMFKGDK